MEFKETIEAPADPTEEDIDDNLRGSVYDHSPEHVELVVEDILITGKNALIIGNTMRYLQYM